MIDNYLTVHQIQFCSTVATWQVAIQLEPNHYCKTKRSPRSISTSLFKTCTPMVIISSYYRKLPWPIPARKMAF